MSPVARLVLVGLALVTLSAVMGRDVRSDGVSTSGDPPELADAATLATRASGGDVEAQRRLAELHVRTGTTRSDSLARYWAAQAASVGDTAATYLRGQILVESIGGPRDPDRGVELLRSIADGGHVASSLALARYYRSDRWGLHDERWAAWWTHGAAEAGDAGAQYDLGRRYVHGRGVDRNLASARHWFIQASENGHRGAARLGRRRERWSLVMRLATGADMFERVPRGGVRVGWLGKLFALGLGSFVILGFIGWIRERRGDTSPPGPLWNVVILGAMAAFSIPIGLTFVRIVQLAVDQGSRFWSFLI